MEVLAVCEKDESGNDGRNNCFRTIVLPWCHQGLSKTLVAPPVSRKHCTATDILCPPARRGEPSRF